MGMPMPPVKRFSPREYYELERPAEYKSDFYDGKLFAMAGGTARHSLITSNVNREVGNRLKGTPCRAYESNLRLKAIATGLRTYPDVSVYCGPLQQDPEDTEGETYTNPSVLFEVLSPSTEGYDRVLKASSYRQIETVKSYVLISETEPRAEIFERQADASWLRREARGLEATLAISAINVRLPLAEIYEGVDFASS